MDLRARMQPVRYRPTAVSQVLLGLLIDAEADPYLRAVLVGMLREADLDR